jgi:hypothetical protein
MNQLTGFMALLFAAFLLIVSSITNVKVIAQGNDNSSEKSTTAAKTCSPEVFKENPGLYATCVALAHNKESAASSEKPETGTPIEVKKGPTIQKANAGECPAGQAKDWAGICFILKECKASISAQPGTCTQSEEEKTTGMLTAEKMEIKKPATSSNPESENCLKTETKSGESLCLTAPAIPKLSYPYQIGRNAAKARSSMFDVCFMQHKFNGDDLTQCSKGYNAGLWETGQLSTKPVAKENCKVPEAGMKNGIGSLYITCEDLKKLKP